MANPTSLTDSDRTALRNTLFENWYCDVFVSMIMVHNYNGLADEYIPFQVDLVPCRYNTGESYVAIIFNHNYGFTCWVLDGDAEPSMLSQAYRIAEADPGCPRPTHLTGEMK
jgi:hypothetical protein